MYCSIETRLVNRYAKVSADYFAAVSELSGVIAGTRSGPSFYESIGKLSGSAGRVSALPGL